jgi:hypothetical protein
MNDIQKLVCAMDYFSDAFDIASDAELEAWFTKKCEDLECSIYPAIYKTDKKRLIKHLEKCIELLKKDMIDTID